MSSNWRRIVALVAVVMLGWFIVSRSGGQDDIFWGEIQRGEKDKTRVAIPNVLGAPRVQWEYKVMGFDEPMANNLGKDGWELVTIFRQNDADVQSVFKRPIEFKLEK